MNASGMKLLARMKQTLQDVSHELENLKDACQDDYDEMSEARQESDRGEELENEIAVLEEIIDSVGAAIETFDQLL